MSKITGTVRGYKWEVPLSPNSRNGLVKNCVVRVDQTRKLFFGSFSPSIGTLGELELKAAEDCLKEYFRELNSPS